MGLKANKTDESNKSSKTIEISEVEEIRTAYAFTADVLVAKLSRYAIAMFFIMSVFGAICDVTRVYDINKYFLALAFFITAGVFFIPSITCSLMNKHIEKLPAILSVLFPVTTGFFYTAVTFHNVLIFAIPLIIILFYNDKKLVVSGFISTILSYFASISIKYYVGIVPDTICNSFKDTVLVSIMPSMVVLCILGTGAYVISSRFSELIDQIVIYSTELEQKQEDLNELVDNSGKLITAQRSENPDNILDAIVMIVKRLLHEDDVPYVVGINPLGQGWNIKSEGGKYSFAEKGDHIHLGFIRKAYSFDYDQKVDDSELFMHDRECISFPFYDSKKLVGFAIFSVRMRIEKRESLVTAYALISKAVSNCILNNKIFATQEELVFNLAEVCEAKSEQTGQHVKRVAKYMEIFGDALGLDPLEKKIVSIASMLHDVGKLTIPIEILDKPSKLTDEEYEIIKSHTKMGYDMLKNCSGYIMQYASKMALQHHERWDGRGYNKIAGEDIDFYSRYVAVADVFDALSSKRSYKKAWTTDEVRDEIVRCKGTQFCPDAVDKFVENYDRFVQVRESMPDAD